MNLDLSGLYYLDGIDMWKAWNLIIQIGSADFLKYPAKKPSITHDWPDQHGLDVDLSKVYLQARSGTLQCVIATDTEGEFFRKHDDFLARLIQPGTRRLTIAAHGGRSYKVYYKECSAYRQLPSGKLTGLGNNQVLHEFGITLEEPTPEVFAFDQHIIADDGAFIIT